MSNLYVKITGAEGESSHPSYKGYIECVAMRHAIVLPVVSAAIRVEGTSTHGPIVLSHQIDKASPILKQAALTGFNLGSAEIVRLRTVGGRSVPTELIKLSNVFVVRVDLETLVDEATRELSDEFLESFHLEYSDIQWEQKRFVGDREMGFVEGGWSVATQSVV